ncbi:MAG: hypothetical protein KGJ57_15705 [Sphingomonadales bacterium]|nr:hypothetical protein [Sphingomonadales bacterium]MDE2170849.1 hypothetical protein [Sphingomonadales bacterium]
MTRSWCWAAGCDDRPPHWCVTILNGLLQTTALLIEEGLIRAIYVTRNPDKLQHVH